MKELKELRDLLVGDPSIATRYGTRIYFQLLPPAIDKEKVWCRWGFSLSEVSPCLGGDTAYNSHSLFVDVLSRDINLLPTLAAEVRNALEGKSTESILDITLTGETYSNYQDRDFYMLSTNFTFISVS
jgi:hypothetical protein